MEDLPEDDRSGADELLNLPAGSFDSPFGQSDNLDTAAAMIVASFLNKHHPNLVEGCCPTNANQSLVGQ